MKKLSKVLIAIAFYFIMENPTEIPGVRMTTIVSGFRTMAQCEDYRDQTKEFVQAMGIPVAFSGCEEQKAA